MSLADARSARDGSSPGAQLRLPITIAGAGLPSLATLTGEAKSYAERMFTFPVIGSLAESRPTKHSSFPPTDEGVGGGGALERWSW